MLQVLERAEANKLVLKESKLVLFQPQMSFMGYLRAGDGIRPQNEKLDVMRPLWHRRAGQRHRLGA